jgi:hypothetical protein
MADGNGWFGFDDLFWITLLVVFLSAFLGAIIPLLRTNRCLALFDDYHVTYTSEKGDVRWGDLNASSHGVELVYDSPFTNSRGMRKTGMLVFEDELEKCFGFCRTVHSLNETERQDRARQITVTFNPNLYRRTLRYSRNAFDMFRDAISKSFGLAAGAVSGRLGTALSKQKGEIGDIGDTLTGVFGNAYEPLLERLIGKNVILQCATVAGASDTVVEFSGYLVDYTEKYLAVFNIEQNPLEIIELEVTESVEAVHYKISVLGDHLTIRSTGREALVLREISQGSSVTKFDVAILPGCEHRISIVKGQVVALCLERTYELDLVIPRNKARIRFASE